MLAGGHHGTHEVLPLQIQPGQRVRQTSKHRGPLDEASRPEQHRRLQHVRQVPVDPRGDGRAPLLGRFLGLGALAGEQPEQVMEAVSARRQRLHQCRVGELLKGRLDTGQLAVGHRRGDADADLRHAEQAEQPERPSGLGLELPVAQ